MAYDIDVLITYSNEDNAPSDNGEGWVTNFKKFLEIMLLQVLGEKPNVMTKSEHDSITGANLKKVAVMVPIITPQFIASGESVDTLESFFNTTTESDYPRVFKVVKRPIPYEEQPAKLRDLIGYDLYEFDLDSGEATDFRDFFSPEAERSYWMKMVDLAYDINESLMSIKYSKETAFNTTDRKSIYLAETGYDLTIQRNIIKRELQRHGYRVLPEHTLPQDIDALKKEVERELEECSLSIHLVGSSYGEIPDGSDRSVVDIQNQLAAEKSVNIRDKSKFARMIWISSQLNHASEKQLAFIENIKRDTASAEGTEILQTPLEDFKNIIREELIEVSLNKRFGFTDETSNGKPAIYLLHDKLDAAKIAPYQQAIENAGYRVLTPAFQGDLLELRQKHIHNLRSFDAAVIYQGDVNNQWVRMKLLDLLKAPGFGRNKPIKGKAIISNRDDKLDISSYKNYNVQVIDGDEHAAVESLKGFLEEINE